MSKQYLTLLSFATLLCMMLFGAVSCKKDDTPDLSNADFFIDVDFLPESETNGEVAPRLMANFNDEMVMIEIRPSADSAAMETVLFLCPDHEAYMMCGNKNLMIFAPYDMETNTPSRDVLLVTPMDDNALVLTKCFIDWNTNTIATGDMMVLPIDDSKYRETKGDIDGEIREFFFNRLVKPLAKSFEEIEGLCGFFGSRAKLVFSYIRITTVTGLVNILYSDDPKELLSHMEQVITTETASGVQSGVLHSFPREYHEMASRTIAATEWSKNGGHGKVNNYAGGGGEEHNIPYATLYRQGYDMTAISTSATPLPVFSVSLNVGNVTENSAYLKGSYRSGSIITPVRMGYIIKESGGPEQTQLDMNFQGTTITGLQKATKYTAFAYATSAMGERVLSPGVTFWTLGFDAFPTSLTFPAEGDTKIVGLSYSDEDITNWNITSKPSWCTITKDDDKTFSVKVGKSTKTRSGTITITAHSNALGNVTENIEVTQLGTNSWEGTSWVFTGMVTTHDIDGSSSSNEVGFTLMVNSVPNNIEFSYAQILSSAANGYSDNYVIDGNGKLVYNASATYSGEWGNNRITSRVTFTRTSSTTATADFHYQEVVDSYGTITASGLLQGTLIRADEVGNYETTVNLKTPVFDNKALKNK